MKCPWRREAKYRIERVNHPDEFGSLFSGYCGDTLLFSFTSDEAMQAASDYSIDGMPSEKTALRVMTERSIKLNPEREDDIREAFKLIYETNTTQNMQRGIILT